MRKWISFFLLSLWTLCSFNACIMDIDNELPDCPPTEENPVAVTASLYCNGRRVDWPDSSRIGVMLLQSTTGRFVQAPPSKPYFLSDPVAEFFRPVSAGEAITRPSAGDSYDAIGVYPLSVAVGDDLTAPFSVADQSVPAALDLILARRTVGIENTTDTVHLDFYRQMSRLLFTLSLDEIDAAGTRTEAGDKLAGARIEIDGMDVAAVFSWKDFLLATSDPGIFEARMQAGGQSGEAIVYPRPAGQGVTFRVTLPAHPDTIYTFAMDPSLILAACKAYTFEMKLEYRTGGDTPGPEPGSAHNVSYRFEGEANSGNVAVYRDGLSTPWAPGDIVRVADHGSFTFAYDSELDVSIRTAEGKTISLSPGQPYHFEDITADVEIIISARPAPATHRVNYLFEGEANPSNVKVYKHGLYTPWAVGEYVTVPHRGEFSFGYLSGLDKITVRTADGKTYPVRPDALFTLSDITADITLIISGKTEPSTTVYHRVTYEYNGELDRENTPVQGTADRMPYPDWEPNQTIFVADNGDFVFRYDTPGGYTGDVTVTLNGKVVPDIKSGVDRPFRGVTEDMHFILYDKKFHTVTVITNLADSPTTETNTLVVAQDRFEMTVPPGSHLVVKVDGVTVQPAGGKYVIEHVTKDTVIVITNDKGGQQPDLIIKADVHDWEELPVVDGGVIIPDKN